MDLYAFVRGHPNNGLVKSHAFKGFVCSYAEFQYDAKLGRSVEKRVEIPLQGITKVLSSYTGNYDHRHRYKTAQVQKKKPKKAVKQPVNLPSAPKSRVEKNRTKKVKRLLKPRGRFDGMLKGRLIHTETQLVARLLQTAPVLQSSSSSSSSSSTARKPTTVTYISDEDDDNMDDDTDDLVEEVLQSQEENEDTRFDRRSAQLNHTLRLASFISSQNGQQKAVSTYTQAFIRSMINLWNWKPMEAEWVVGDVCRVPSRGIFQIGSHATPIDFVAVNLNNQRLILGELKSSYNHGVFYREQGRMTGAFSSLDNSPAMLAKIQLVMGALMFIRQFEFEATILYDGIIELYVVHLPTMDGETVKALRISEEEIRTIQRALYKERLLISM